MTDLVAEHWPHVVELRRVLEEIAAHAVVVNRPHPNFDDTFDHNDSPDLGRRIVAAIAQYERSNGSRWRS